MRSNATNEHTREFVNGFNSVLTTTTKAIHKLPQNAIAARHEVHRIAISASKCFPIKLSDEYIKGAVDIFASLALLYVTTPVVFRCGRRYATAENIPVSLINGRAKLHGTVIAVRDGDNLRVRHTSFFDRLLHIKNSPKGKPLSETTINLRLAGIDAPECASFGRPGQKFGPIAREWLKKYSMGRKVSFKVHSIDQYRRAVATVYRKPNSILLRMLGFPNKNIGLELTRSGYATLYTGSGAKYGGERLKRLYTQTESAAKKRRAGMWSADILVTPKQYKQAERARRNVSNFASSTGKNQTPMAKEPGNKGGGIQQPKTAPVVFKRMLQDMYKFLRDLR